MRVRGRRAGHRVIRPSRSSGGGGLEGRTWGRGVLARRENERCCRAIAAAALVLFCCSHQANVGRCIARGGFERCDIWGTAPSASTVDVRKQPRSGAPGMDLSLSLAFRARPRTSEEYGSVDTYGQPVHGAAGGDGSLVDETQRTGCTIIQYCGAVARGPCIDVEYRRNVRARVRGGDDDHNNAIRLCYGVE